MTTLALIGGGVAALVLLLWLFGRAQRKRGASEQRSDDMEETLDDVEMARRARNDLNDADTRDRLRDKHIEQ